MSRIEKVKSLLAIVFSLLVTLFYSSITFGQADDDSANKKEITIGVLAVRGEENSRQMWELTAKYLESKLAGYRFTLKPLTLSQMNAAVQNEQLDFVLTNTGNYVYLEALYGITRVATLKNMRQGQAYTSFGGVIFVRADRDDIEDLDDLKGKSFAAVSKQAFGGFQMAWRELKQRDIDPFTDFASIEFLGFPQDNIVKSVRDQKVDAGTVRTDTLKRMSLNGDIELDEFKILNPQVEPDFPFLRSTRLYPEWPFSRTKKTDDNFASQVVIALLSLTRDHPASIAGLNAGWTVPLNYQDVHEMFKELKVEPYAKQEKVTLMQIINQYRYWLILIAFAIMFTIYHYIRVERLVVLRTAELSTSNDALEIAIAESKQNEQELTEHRGHLTELVEEQTAELISANNELKNNIELLNETQSQLVQSEKMASLGGLVAGFSHEINTPLGIGVTSASNIEEEIGRLQNAFETGEMKRSDLEKFIAHANQASTILLQNLNRAADLIRSFKQVAIDQSNEDWRTINLHDYIDEIILSLKPKWKYTSTKIVNDCASDLEIYTHPGAIYQILSNLIVNALIYAFDDNHQGIISIHVAENEGEILLDFKDQGKGIAKDNLKQIFDPFFTTRRGTGGSGLGLHIVFNLVNSTLKGTIICESNIGEGTTFRIKFPIQKEK